MEKIVNNGIIKFQFHKGTIETCFYHTLFYPPPKFQFHKGTIETDTEEEETERVSHFNSIKVRLKL